MGYQKFRVHFSGYRITGNWPTTQSSLKFLDLLFLHVCCPGNFKSLFDALVNGTVVFVVRESSFGFRLFSLGDFQVILETYSRDAEDFSIFFDAPFDIRFQFIRCGDSARFQRAGKCAGQSTGERGDDVVNCCRQRRRVLHPIKSCVASMRPKLQRLRESFNMSLSQRPLLLNQADFCRVNDFAHDLPLSGRCDDSPGRFKRARYSLFIVLNQGEDIEPGQLGAAVQKGQFHRKGSSVHRSTQISD